MGKKGTKKYIRVCENYHSQFNGYKEMPVGAYYGRNGNTFFVLLNESLNWKGNYEVEILTQKGNEKGNADWHKGNVSCGSEIGKMIGALIREKGNPKIKTHNREIGVNNMSRLEPVNYRGKKYRAFPCELSLPDIKIEREIRETGDCPVIRGMREPNLTRGRRIRKESEAEGTTEPFIRDSVVIANEDSYWKIGKDVQRWS